MVIIRVYGNYTIYYHYYVVMTLLCILGILW